MKLRTLVFFVVPELSFASEDAEQGWFINFKLGLDNCLPAGFEHALGNDKKHAVGY